MVELSDDFIQAWNTFVMNSEHSACEVGSERRAAAIANHFMALANNGGLNAFLTYSYDLAAREVVASLDLIGASLAADELRLVLDNLGVELEVQTQNKRWDLLELHWHDALDDHDVLSDMADQGLMSALQKHVCENRSFYVALT
jgi:hypothetical protein